MPPMPQRMREGGLAGLPAHNVGKNYDTGGIVAFDEGGNIQNELTADQYFDKLEAPNAPARMARGGKIKHYDGTDGSTVTGDPAIWTVDDQSNFDNYKKLATDNPDLVKNNQAIAKTLSDLQGKHDLYAQQVKARHDQNVAAEMALRYGIKDVPHAVIPGAAPAGSTAPAGSIAPAGFTAPGATTPPAGGSFSERIRASMGVPMIKADTSALDEILSNRPKEVQPQSVDDFLNQVAKANERFGIGSASDAYNKYLNKRQEDMGEQMKLDKRLTLANAGFAMARAAGQPGQGGTGFSKFLNSLAVGGENEAQGIMGLHQQQRKTEQAMAEDRLKLAQSEEMRKAGYVKDATILAKESQRDAVAQNHWYDQVAMEKSKLEEQAAQTNAQLRAHMEIARTTAHPYGGADMWYLQANQGRINPATGKEFTPDELMGKLYGMKHDAMIQVAREKLLQGNKTYQDLNAIAANIKDPNKVAAARNKMTKMEQDILSGYGGGLGSLPTGTDRGMID